MIFSSRKICKFLKRFQTSWRARSPSRLVPSRSEMNKEKLFQFQLDVFNSIRCNPSKRNCFYFILLLFSIKTWDIGFSESKKSLKMLNNKYIIWLNEQKDLIKYGWRGLWWNFMEGIAMRVQLAGRITWTHSIQRVSVLGLLWWRCFHLRRIEPKMNYKWRKYTAMKL